MEISALHIEHFSSFVVDFFDFLGSLDFEDDSLGCSVELLAVFGSLQKDRYLIGKVTDIPCEFDVIHSCVVT